MTFPFPFLSASGKAPPDSFTSLLLHFNGADGSTDFPDSSTYGQVISRVGTTAKISTAQSRFGGSSLFLNGAGCLQVADAANLRMGTGDFTVDFWARYTDIRDQTLIEKGYSGGGSFFLGIRGSTLSLYTAGGGWAEGLAGPSMSQWQHYAMVRSGSTLRVYVDGVQKYSRTDTTNFNATGLMYIGAFSGGSWPFYGNIDELRVSKGIARWITDFAPPSAPY